MDKLIDLATNFFSGGNIVYGLAVVLAIFLFKYDPIKLLIHYAEKPNKEIDRIMLLLQSNKLSVHHNDFLIDYVEAHSFQNLRGIKADRPFREYLFNFYTQHSSRIGWFDLRVARPFYQFDGEKLVVTITKKDTIVRWGIDVFAALIGGMGILSVLGILTLNLFEPQKFTHLAAFTILGYAFITASAIINSINWKYYSAKKLRAIMENQPEVKISQLA